MAPLKTLELQDVRPLVSPLTTSPILCVGETLWDVLPHGEFLGGAPLNVAAHLTRLGSSALLVSRVGADARGHLALEQMRALGLDTRLVQVDPQLPTGIARAEIDSSGSASYVFPAPAAWDRIASVDAAIEAARQCRSIVYGTLSQRSAANVAALDRMLDVARHRVLDVNLRAPHDDREAVLAALARADFVKINVDELRIIAGWLSVGPDPELLRAALVGRFSTRTLCITEGARGARLWHGQRWYLQPSYPTQVANTIGAGDAFLAMLLAELSAGLPPQVAMDRAARLSAFVASQPGAVPAYDAASFRA